MINSAQFPLLNILDSMGGDNVHPQGHAWKEMDSKWSTWDNYTEQESECPDGEEVDKTGRMIGSGTRKCIFQFTL